MLIGVDILFLDWLSGGVTFALTDIGTGVAGSVSFSGPVGAAVAMVGSLCIDSGILFGIYYKVRAKLRKKP